MPSIIGPGSAVSVTKQAVNTIRPCVRKDTATVGHCGEPLTGYSAFSSPCYETERCTNRTSRHPHRAHLSPALKPLWSELASSELSPLQLSWFHGFLRESEAK